ncbi:MAG: hypothetical protein C4527_23965 [Candidatus Omnitrophota bacterium]|nr:MAG: hypothetical protein C4527_23965 [Candidatus Omnitrophota bacterium]
MKYIDAHGERGNPFRYDSSKICFFYESNLLFTSHFAKNFMKLVFKMTKFLLSRQGAISRNYPN